MSDIALSRSFEHPELSRMFQSTLPGIRVVLVAPDDFGADSEVSRPCAPGNGLLTCCAVNGIYPLGISLCQWPGSADEGVLVALARHLSEHLNCDAVCDGTVYGDAAGNPYFSVLWQSGEAWLADDCGVDPYDATGEAVRPLRRLTGPMPWLGPTGRVELG